MPSVTLTKAEILALLEAVGQMTDGNARDYPSWEQQTGGTPAQWRALLRGEVRLIEASRT